MFLPQQKSAGLGGLVRDDLPGCHSGALTLPKTTSTLRRRQFLGGLMAIPAMLSFSPSGAASASQEDLLRRDLAALKLPVDPAVLHLVRFSQAGDGNGVRFAAVVRLDWRTGRRQHRFQATARDPDGARADLVRQVGARLSGVAAVGGQRA